MQCMSHVDNSNLPVCFLCVNCQTTKLRSNRKTVLSSQLKMHLALFLIYPIELNTAKITIYCIRKYRLFRPYPESFFQNTLISTILMHFKKNNIFFFINFYIKDKSNKSLALTRYFQISLKMCSPLYKAYLYIVKYILLFSIQHQMTF